MQQGVTLTRTCIVIRPSACKYDGDVDLVLRSMQPGFKATPDRMLPATDNELKVIKAHANITYVES